MMIFCYSRYRFYLVRELNEGKLIDEIIESAGQCLVESCSVFVNRGAGEVKVTNNYPSAVLGRAVVPEFSKEGINFTMIGGGVDVG